MMEKLGKLGMLPLNLLVSRGHLHRGLPWLYLPVLTSLSVHPPPLPLASKETSLPRRRRKCCWLLPGAPLTHLVIWGLFLCTGFRSPWGSPCWGDEPIFLESLASVVSLPGTQCQPLSVPPMASCPRDVHARLPFWTVSIVLLQSQGARRRCHMVGMVQDLKWSPWLSRLCGTLLASPPFLFAGAEGPIPLDPTATLDH